MDTSFLCEKRLAKCNPYYHTLVKNTAFVLCNALENYKRYFPDFTDHTILHSMQVLDFCNQLIAENIEQLNEDELYVLIMSAYLHDCGMGISSDDYHSLYNQVTSEEYRNTHIHDNIGETIRAFHQKFSKQLIYKYKDIFEIPSDAHTQAIALVSEGHRKIDIYNEDILPSTIVVPNGNVIHLPYLASLLRLADELDIAADRNIGIFCDEQDTIFKMMHRSIKHLHISEDKFVLDVEADDPALFDDIYKEIKKLEETLILCADVTKKRSPFVITQKTLEINRIKESGSKITILDTDVGTDDAMAFLLLKFLKVQPDYIVASYGNTTPEGALKNAILLKKRLDLPSKIVAGLPIPNDPNLPIAEKNTFHGVDGLAGCSKSMEKALGLTEKDYSDALSFEDLTKIIAKTDSVTYVTIGALTNLSKILENRDLRTKLKGIYVMGGGLKEFNCSHNTEFNFSKHPNAVKNLLALGVNITLFPLDITNHQTLSANDIDELEKIGTYPEFIAFLRHNLKANQEYNHIDGAVLHDTMPILYLSHPKFFALTDKRIISDDFGHIEESASGNAIHVCSTVQDGMLKRVVTQAFQNKMIE